MSSRWAAPVRTVSCAPANVCVAMSPPRESGSDDALRLRAPALRSGCSPPVDSPRGETVPARDPWLAVEAGADVTAHQRSLRRVHELYFTGAREARALRSVIDASWRRSRRA